MVRSMSSKMEAAGMVAAPAPDAPPPRATVIGAADDIAWAVLYLASDESRFVNGQKLVIDNTVTITPGVVPAPIS